ncbi:PREDICTED: protein LTV1 homolog [Branchiostoma belcheri]|uniref:Protein LTV1 homolog n=1 Tax=Branchiostoma belcheri TaxID=7741 RepID=A0A6P5AFU4_BRABE|nr:PREDICTED: protein LTV1 homolog [Branchiostoma belcheri]
MPRKKKKFIDNKNAVTFHLVHRSQRDPLLADEDKPQHVLQEVSASSEKRREEQRKYGVYFEDEYDYLQHLKEPGEAVLEPIVSRVSIKGAEVTEPHLDETPKLQLPASVFPSEQEEDVGMLNKAAPLVGPQLDWDPDLVAALDDDFNYDDPDNVLEDDFIAMATAGPSGKEEEADDCSDEEYPSDECEMESEDEEEDGSSEGMTYRTTKSRFTEYSITSSVMRRNEGLTLLDDRFEKMYEEYDDDEVGPLDHEELTGTVQQDSLVLNNILQEYEKKKEESVIRRLDPVREGMEGEGEEGVSSESESEEDELVKMVTEQPKEKWDCESILSTYSSIYNHPTVIKDPPKPKKGKQIILSQKSGIPIGVLGSKGLTKKQLEEQDRLEEGESSEEEEMEITIRSAPARKKGETAEEKKLRKQAVKAERRERRIEKKANKLAFKEEASRQEKIVMNQKNLKGIKLA